MKNLFIILLLFIISDFSFGQKGFKKIREAEELIEKGAFKKAKRILNQASKMDYGFCGNAWVDANIEINKNKAIIYYKQKKYQKALKYISTNFRDFDELKMQILIAWQGKEKVKKEIDENISLLHHYPLEKIEAEQSLKLNFSFIKRGIHFCSFVEDEFEKVTLVLTKEEATNKQTIWIGDLLIQSSIYKMLEDSIYTKPEIQAEVIGGTRYLLKWIRKNLKVDEKVKKMGIDLSRIWLEFIVEKDGSINNMKIAHTYKDFDINNFITLKPMNEIIYKPAYHQGKAVRSKVKLPISIHLK